MRSKFLFLAMLAATAAPATADDHPLFRPSRDVAVEYRSAGMTQGSAANPGGPVTMRFASKTSRIRIEGAGGRGYAILDPDAGRMTMVMAEKQMYVERPADPGMIAMFRGTNTAFKKTGTDTVAGVTCTVYEATINERNGQVCLTGDGVLLRARSNDPEHRELEATKVTYADQPAALFETPAGYQKLDIPDMTGGGRRPMSDFGPPHGPPGSNGGSQSGH
jgi:hypothetical protein